MFDLIPLIKWAGYAGLFAIIFAESGLLIGVLLPGDSLLFTAGLLASQGFLDIRWLIAVFFVAAITGDSVGYAFGHRVGRRLFKKEDSLIFHKDHLERAQNFFSRHGGKTLILARFLPLIRSFAPILAGIGKMNYRLFVFYNIVGAILWTFGLTLLGYYFGKTIPNVDHYLLPIVGVIVLLSVSPTAYHLLKDANTRKKIAILAAKILSKFFGRGK